MDNPKIIICPDSYKGTIDSVEATNIIGQAVTDAIPNAEIVKFPMADGGEGTLECINSVMGGRFMSVNTKNAHNENITAEYLLTENYAIIETARVVGLYMTNPKNPEITTTYGVGLLIKDALKYTSNIILTLGGSATNDGGCGIAAALNAKFYNIQGKSFIPTGKTLKDIESIDIEGMPKFNMECMCDVTNPMYGENGAAYVYAPQKGADAEMVKRLDTGLRHLSKKIYDDVHRNVSIVKGGGAAGAIASGMIAFCDAKLKSGIDIMLDLYDFDNIIKNANFIITGEGKLDEQSFSGKVIGGIISRAQKKPVIAIAGTIDNDVHLKYRGLTCAVATSKPNAEFSEIKKTAKDDLYKTAYNLMNSIVF